MLPITFMSVIDLEALYVTYISDKIILDVNEKPKILLSKTTLE